MSQIFVNKDISLTPTVPTSFVEDAGTAIPALNVIDIKGTAAQGISTSGAANVVTITASNSSTIQKGVVALATASEVKQGTDSTKAITPSTLNSIMADSVQTGFVSWGGAGPYFDDTTIGSFTILVGGTGYINSKLITWTVPQTIATLTSGSTWYIYIDSLGFIGKTNVWSESLYQNNIVLFECFRDSTLPTNNQITVKENHPYSFPTNVSLYCHEVVGSVIENNSNGANITLNGTQGIQINGADVLADHGLNTTIPDSGGLAITWRKYYTTAGGKWAQQNNTNTFTGFWNNGGTPTALTGTRFGIYTLYASKDSLNSTSPFYFAVLDNAQYISLTLANNAISNGVTAKATNELAGIEVVQLGYIIYHQSTSSIVQVTISKTTLKQTLSTTGTNTASLINTNVTNFNGWLSAADTNVQAALETLDNILGKDGVQVATTVGNTTGTTSFNINTGTGGSTVTTTNGIFTVNTGTGNISLGTDAAAKTVTIGNTTGASTLALKTGTGDFTLASATGTIINALDTGEITYPLQPSFLAYLGSSVLNVTGTGTLFTLGTTTALTEVFDQNNDFNGTTFTAPVSGRYSFSASVLAQGCAAAISGQIIIHTSNRDHKNLYNRAASNVDFNFGRSTMADMDAGDVATCQVIISGEASDIVDIYGDAAGNCWTSFCGQLLC